MNRPSIENHQRRMQEFRERKTEDIGTNKPLPKEDYKELVKRQTGPAPPNKINTFMNVTILGVTYKVSKITHHGKKVYLRRISEDPKA